MIQAQSKRLDSIRRAFTAKGFKVIDSSDDEAMMENLAMMPSNLVFVVDDTSTGSKVCSMIRCFSNMPIVALCRDEERSRVEMLNLGAGACVTRPVSPLELMARVQSLMRRYRGMYPSDENNDREDRKRCDRGDIG